MVTVEDMLRAYYDCRRTKRKKDSSLKFETDFETLCCDLVDAINDRAYEIGPSICFVVTKPTKREVFAADFRDRVVHHWWMQRMEPMFEAVFIPDTYNCRKGKGTLYGVNRLAEKTRIVSEDYTRDCWIGKFDMQGFFMSIHKPTLWAMLEDFIYRNYRGTDIADVLYVGKKIVMHSPEKNCIRKTSLKAWEGLPPEKSLFTCGDDNGEPIGNLPSQADANYYLHPFDLLMVAVFLEGYCRYVDDFVIVSTSKQQILDAIPRMRDYLWENMRVRLHPRKIYVQHYTKGVKFIGGVVKPHRVYSSNRTVDHFLQLVESLNRHPERYDTEAAVSRLNSYLGFLRHTASYTIRRRTIDMLSPYWWERIYVKGHYEVVVAKKGEKSKARIINTIKERKELWLDQAA